MGKIYLENIQKAAIAIMVLAECTDCISDLLAFSIARSTITISEF